MGLREDQFVALYAGTLGIVSGVDILVEAAGRLRSRPDIVLLCVGEGVLKERMQAEARARGLTNIRFEPFQERSAVPQVHAAADACVLTMRKDYGNASAPSKLISYAAAGRPIVCSAHADTEAAKMVAAAGAGIVTPPGDADALAGAILRIGTSGAEAAAMGANARRYFERELSFRHRYRQFAGILREAAAARTRKP